MDADLDLDSDVQAVTVHPNPSAPPLPCHTHLAFPLQGTHLCTQSPGGAFTHHFAGNHHAVDFRSPPHTPVLAADDATVLEVSDTNTLSGIHVGCLFKWNSIMLQLPDGAVAEYVHIAHNSAKVKPGDKVSKGDVICLSGAVGFCPEPHLHFQLLENPDPKAVSLPCRFGPSSFEPQCGKYYNEQGEVVEVDEAGEMPSA
eukprot:TRINITY_DN14682_c0_g1_i1.p1 TRINITY_DN14682_c0_g1~~TRINITY_DN14682_c0_g1_i1.p1  ORF type:complete len:227 (+),score=45.44 TRINITY_DN14682_c0_g1_i1:83-682(+)